MKKLSILMFAILLLNGICESQLKGKWLVTFNGGKKMYDAFIAQVNGDSVQITEAGNTGWYNLNDIRRIELSSEESSALVSGLIGGVIGGGAGYYFGSIEDKYQDEKWGEETNFKYLYGGALLGVGAVAGALMGSNSAVQVVHDLEGLEPKEKKSIVENIIRDENNPTTSKPDVLYLRKGGSIKGVVTENIADSTVSVRAVDGSGFTYKRSEVLMIERTDPSAKAAQLQNTEVSALSSDIALEVNFGVAVPLGEFAAKDQGNALTGFLFDGNVTYPVYINEEQTFSVQSMLSVALSLNNLDVDIPYGAEANIGYWLSGWGLGGVRVINQIGDVDWLITAQGGILNGTIPSVTIKSPNSSLEQFSRTASKFAYKFGAGAVISDRFIFDVNYFYSNPVYDVTVIQVVGANTYVAHGDVPQTVSMVTATVGFIF